MLHKHSWFPFVVILLTIILGSFIFNSYYQKTHGVKYSSEVPTISDEIYQQELLKNTKAFSDSYTSSYEDASRSIVVQSFLNQLLNMRVPSEERELHLELVLSLQQLKEGLTNHTKDAEDGFKRFNEIVAQTSWLNL